MAVVTAFRSPWAAAFANCLNEARSLDIFLCAPFSLIGTLAENSSLKIVAVFFAPFERPALFPLCPFLNCVARGGFL